MTDFPEPRSGFIDARAGRLHFVSRGDPDSPPLVLVHGMRDHARSWDWIGMALADRFHVIAPDLRGHGDSDWARAGNYSMPAFVLDLADLIEGLTVGPFNMVGHSLGGAVSLRYAATFPENIRSLCVIESLELPDVRAYRTDPRGYPLRLKDWVTGERALRRRTPRFYSSIGEAEARMIEAHPTIEHETIVHLVRHGVALDADGALRWKYDNGARLRAPDDADGRDLDEILAAVSCPTLLAYGEESWIPLPPAARLDLLSDHRIVTFPGASHWLHHEARADFLAALTNFLDLTSKGSVYA